MTDTLTFVDLQDAGNAQSQLVLQAIARHADWQTGQCCVRAKQLALMAKCSVPTFRRHLYRLRDDGFITTTERTREDGSGQGASVITLVGYAEWFAVNRKGGKVAKPRQSRRYPDQELGSDSTPPPDQNDQGGDQNDQGSPLIKLTRGVVRMIRGADQQVIRAPDQQVIIPKELSGEPSGEHSPPTPPGGEEGVGEMQPRFDWIEELRSEGLPHHVLDMLATLLAAGLKPWDCDDLKGPARQIAKDHGAQTRAVLERAAHDLLNVHKYRLPPVADFRKAVAEARKTLEAYDTARRLEGKLAGDTAPDVQSFAAGTPEFAAELARWEQADPDYAVKIRERGFVKLRIDPARAS